MKQRHKPCCMKVFFAFLLLSIRLAMAGDTNKIIALNLPTNTIFIPQNYSPKINCPAGDTNVYKITLEFEWPTKKSNGSVFWNVAKIQNFPWRRDDWNIIPVADVREWVHHPKKPIQGRVVEIENNIKYDDAGQPMRRDVIYRWQN